MTEEARQIVEFLGKEPFKRSLNLISFHSIGPENLLQILNDVFAEIDSKHAGDIRDEPPDVRAQRMLTLLKTLKYTPPSTMDVSNFRQGIVLGEKPVLYPILLYLLSNLKSLKTRAYLAKFLVTLPVPDELLHDGSDRDMQDAWVRYKELQSHFSNFHKELKEFQKQSHGTNEIKLDIKTMEDEKENLMRKVERARKKVEGTPDFADVLQVAQRMRSEKQRSDDLQSEIQQQTRLKQSAMQRLQRKRQQYDDIRQTGSDSTPETLIRRMEEDNRLNKYMLEEKLPKERETRRKSVKTLQKIAMEPLMQKDIEELEAKIDEATGRVNRLIEKRMMQGDPTLDKSAVFRQQASILSHKKDTLANTLQEKKEEAAAIEVDLVEKRKTLRALGGQVLKGDDYKMYVAKLRTKNLQYKKCRSNLASLRSEHGVLNRTEVILSKLQNQTNRRLVAAENKKGVSGFRETQDELEKVSAMKSELDEVKHRTLDDMSETVQQLHTLIHEKKALLAPVIKELRPLRQRRQEISLEYEERKAQYDSIAAGLESNRSQLEHTVGALREECANHDSRYYYMSCMCKILQTQLARAESEMKLYTSGDKKKSYREIYNKMIQEQENLAKSLREQQKNVRENYESNTKQVDMWVDLEKLLNCKLKILEERTNEVKRQTTGGMGTLRRETTQERMML